MSFHRLKNFYNANGACTVGFWIVLTKSTRWKSWHNHHPILFQTLSKKMKTKILVRSKIYIYAKATNIKFCTQYFALTISLSKATNFSSSFKAFHFVGTKMNCREMTQISEDNLADWTSQQVYLYLLVCLLQAYFSPW